ncbi:ABC transporter substrate-binding protein [Streptomyces iconiensis]|uniref:ABC transporter substrate-binding protein n=1 Tax=Streptomyces iconiensis TaxID=1384038 RepID=A0ABT7A5Y9_9ACTN|nr:ABC transporter substrate-binding protein [Streptomyces iconiensis]MDJ1136725.1 ABC transporter substrate-binding protein [Streptomyces iconiensis]
MPSSSRMPHLSRRGLLAAGGVAGLGALISACGSDSGSGSGGSKGDAWSFTDGRSKKVSLDAVPERIVAYTGTAAALHDFGVRDKIVGVFGPTKQKNGKPDVVAGDLDISKLEIIGNAYGEFDIEKYAKTRPQLLITNMYVKNALWYVPDESKEKILKLAPAVAMTAAQVPMIEPIQQFAKLAESLGADLKAGSVVDAKARFEKASERLRKAAKSGIRVMAASGSADLLYVSDPSANADLKYFKDLGVNFVVPKKVSSQGFFEELSWENADKYKADLIILDNRTQSLQPPALKSKPSWGDLPAVKAGQVGEWMAEPRFSYAGAAPLVEELAEAIEKAKKVG